MWDFETRWTEACKKAEEAFIACKPIPMIVGQAESIFSNRIVPGTEEIVNDGVCGFAWVNIKPARGDFVKQLKMRNIGNKGVYGGYTISFYEICSKHRGSQSMQRKEAACRAFVENIKFYYPNLKIWVESRLD